MHLNETVTVLCKSCADLDALIRALSAPFDSSAVKFKPAVVSGGRALALAFVDAQVIQDRLDGVLGRDGWHDEYECLPDGAVVCRLRLRLGDEWITKMDVGVPSCQADECDRRKAACSDALRRAAVKVGIGRYLYRLPAQWVDYDPDKRAFVKPPALPMAAQKKTAKAAAPRKKKASLTLPANGAELQQRLGNYDATLAKQGVCQPGELVAHIVQAGVKAGFVCDLSKWNGNAIILAVKETKAFENKKRHRRGERKEVA